MTALTNAEYRRRYQQRHPERVRASNRRWAIAHPRDPRRADARARVREAIRLGRLTRPQFCEIAATIKDDCTGRIEAHHPDYNKPLEVRWLCVKHHRMQHE